LMLTVLTVLAVLAVLSGLVIRSTHLLLVCVQL
jgi:hypothetical protein